MPALDHAPRLIALALGAALAFSAAPASAQSPETVRVRGEIVSLEGSTLSVKPRQGADVAIRLGEKFRLVGVVKASLADVKPGSFIGVTSVQKEGTGSRALEIHIFPEALRGTGEGDRPWDLVPGSSMTNGTASAVEGVDGKTITVAYKGGARVIVTGPDTSVVTYAPADRSELKPGVKVFVNAQKASDGSLTAVSVTMGKEGIAPPM
jgi:Domain of unknown function (DUF5666)